MQKMLVRAVSSLVGEFFCSAATAGGLEGGKPVLGLPACLPIRVVNYKPFTRLRDLLYCLCDVPP